MQKILFILREIAEKYPDLRMGQIIDLALHVTNEDLPLFYMPDEELYDLFVLLREKLANDSI